MIFYQGLTLANSQRPVYRPQSFGRGGMTQGMGRGMGGMPERTPHASYICFRCGEKGTLNLLTIILPANQDILSTCVQHSGTRIMTIAQNLKKPRVSQKCF